MNETFNGIDGLSSTGSETMKYLGCMVNPLAVLDNLAFIKVTNYKKENSDVSLRASNDVGWLGFFGLSTISV